MTIITAGGLQAELRLGLATVPRPLLIANTVKGFLSPPGWADSRKEWDAVKLRLSPTDEAIVDILALASTCPLLKSVVTLRAYGHAVVC